MTRRSTHEDPLPERRSPLPRWLVAFIILGAAGVTAAAMSMTGLRGPMVAWDQASQNVESAWNGEPIPTAGAATLSPGGGATPVALAPRVAAIFAGAPMPHADRGVCTSCHSIVTLQGAPVPAIHSMSVMTHEYRGVCANCHQVSLALGLNAGSPVAGIAAPAPPAPPPAPPAKQPGEAEWQGLEVVPNAQGVAVAGAEGAAQRLGMQTGDLVLSINARPIATMSDFVSATANGTLATGTVIVRRNTQRLAFEFSAPAAVGQTQTGTPWASAPGTAPAVRQQAQF